MSEKTVEQRLQELLDEKDAQLEAVTEERDELKRLVEADPFIWAVQHDVPDRGLPVPRLEIEWTPDAEWGWRRATGTYRLVMKHFMDGVVGIGLEQVVNQGGRGIPINPPSAHRPGKVDLSSRIGAHICHDMATLKLPGFAICGYQVDDLSDLAGKPHER
jgi:hypothetical protein